MYGKINIGIIMLLMVVTAVQAGNIASGQAKAALCAGCHSSSGTPGISATDAFPNLRGQKATYVVKQLKAFKSGERKDATMQGMAATLSEQDMKDVAAYFASLK